jgi:hypothetical protein
MKMIFDVLSPCIGDCHPAAGVAGLLLALESLPDDQQVFTWQRLSASSFEVTWQGDLVPSWNHLIRETFKLDEGIVSIPGASPKLFTHDGFLQTLLQSPKTRPQTGKTVLAVPSNYGSVAYPTLQLEKYIHQGFADKLMIGQGRNRRAADKIEALSWLIPNCSGGMTVSVETAIAALFSPLTWAFYKIEEPIGSTGKLKYSTALCCPIISNLDRIVFAKPLTLEEFVASSLADACLHFANLNGCHVHGYQYWSPQVNRVAAIIAAGNYSPNPGYDQLRQSFPNTGGRKKTDDSVFVAANSLRGLAATNIARGLPWYQKIADTDFKELSHNRVGLIRQTESRQAKWKANTGFESSDRRKGYHAGYNACTRGTLFPLDLPDTEWGKGYRQGFEAAKAKSDRPHD